MLADYLPCFSTVDITISEKKRYQSYMILFGNFTRLHESITDKAVFGQDYKCDAKLAADLNMLILFFKMIYEERIADQSYDWQHYVDTYCLELVKKAFYCRGVIIDELEDLWRYWGMTSQEQDGIGHMQMEGDGTNVPVFRVRWPDGEDPEV